MLYDDSYPTKNLRIHRDFYLANLYALPFRENTKKAFVFNSSQASKDNNRTLILFYVKVVCY